ncbi:MAG: sigma-70 family RNA polymerase sigma factor [Verrucomicrobiae bacterium]|nr:sigma-70 family RNA polymerase sigma factor [Verrucomicrobiae bacterium]
MPEEKLEPLYDAHAAALFAYALQLTRSETEARDVLQEVFMRLARREILPADLRDARAFLLRMTHHVVVDTVRRRDSRRRTEDAMATEPVALFAPTIDPDEAAFREALANALRELPPDQRAVVHLKLWEGLTFEQIATLLDLSPNTAASRFRYGIDKLRTLLRPLYQEIR